MGTGHTECVSCGDPSDECACDDSDCPECERCDGTGIEPESKT